MQQNDSNNVLVLLSEKLGRFHRSNKDYVFKCPDYFCKARTGSPDKHNHLYINIDLVINGEKGWYHCVTEDTYINTDRGLIEIGMLNDCETIFTLSGYRKANIINTGSRECFEVITDFGYEVKTTCDERFYVLDAGLNKVWKEVRDLHIGDYVAIDASQMCYSKNNDLVFEYDKTSYGRSPKMFILPNRMNEELAKILGYLTAEGNVGKNGRCLEFTQNKGEVVDDYMKTWLSCFPDSDLHVYPNGNSNNCSVRCDSRYISDFFKNALGYCLNSTASTKCVPSIIFESSLSCIRSFLQCCFEGDGNRTNTQVRYFSTSKELCLGIQRLLLLFGIVSSVTVDLCNSTFNDNLSSTMPNPLYKLVISGYSAVLFMSKIGFVSKRKNASLKGTVGVRGKRFPYIVKALRDEACISPEIVDDRIIRCNCEFISELYINRYMQSDKGVLLKTLNSNLYHKIMDIIGDDKLWVRIKSIKFCGMKQTYDAFVLDTCESDIHDDYVHNFNANGFVLHNCFRCGSSGPIKKIIGDDVFVANDYISFRKQVLNALNKTRIASAVVADVVTLPDDYYEMDKNTDAYKYCQSRGITDEDIKYYHIGLGTNELSGRIIFPDYDLLGNVVYWTARSYTGHKNKYKNCKASVRDKIFNFSNCLKAGYKTVIITEGVISAIMTGRNAIATYGKQLTREKLNMLILAPFEEYILAFDADTYKRIERRNNDTYLKSETFELATVLSNNGKKVRLVEYDNYEDDPATVNMKQKIENAKEFDFRSVEILM